MEHWSSDVHTEPSSLSQYGVHTFLPTLKVHLHEIFCFKLVWSEEPVLSFVFKFAKIFEFSCIPILSTSTKFHSAYYLHTVEGVSATATTALVYFHT